MSTKENIRREEFFSQEERDELAHRFYQSEKYLQKKFRTFEDKEKLFSGVRSDSTSDDGVISDGSLATLVIERAARIMSQLQSGKVKEIGNTASSAAHIANLIYHHDIVPNANSGNPFLVKLRQVQMGSGIYGMYPVYYGLNVTENNAFADFWLVKPQKYFPQPGKFTPRDRKWTQLETEVTIGQLKLYLQKEKTTWSKQAIGRLIAAAAEKSPAPHSSSHADNTNYGERTNYDREQISGEGDNATVVLRTEYQSGENGRWITYAPDYENEILRSVLNPHKNGLIPCVEKIAIPLFDEVYGLSDFDRGMAIQKAIDSFSNLGYQNALLNVLPPLKIKTGSIISSTISLKPAAQWHMNDLNAVQPFTTGTTSAEYFQTSISSLRSILLNQNGTTDTQLNSQAAMSPQFGKTPEALRMQSSRQNARDNWDLTMMDIFYSELASGLLDAKINYATKPVVLSLGKKDVSDIEKDRELLEYVNIANNVVTINLAKLKNKKYRYAVDSGTSTEADDATEHARWQEVLTVISSNPSLIELAKADGYVINIGAALDKFISTTGSNDITEVIRKKTEEELAQEQQEPPYQEGLLPMQEQPTEEEPPEEGSNLHPITQSLLQDPDVFIERLRG